LVADRVRAVPAWAWLAAIVTASFLLRAWLARDMVAPFIMVDELIYSELARSIASSGDFLVRDLPASGYSTVYPVLISPAYVLFDSLPTAYGAVKTINAAVMSLAAVPAYLLARRMLGVGLSLLAAVLAVALPSLAYTGTVMTENVFYPVFLLVALQLVLVLERPTGRRLAALFVLLALAYATRVQAVAVVPAIAVAPVLFGLFERRPLRAALRPFLPLYVALAAGATLVVLAQVVRGRSLADLFGAYSVVGDHDYALRDVADYLVWHLAELDLYLGVLPVAATIVLTGLVRGQPRPVQAFLAAALPLTAFLALAVAAFASEFAGRIQERNLFVVAPFFLVSLLVWIGQGAPRRPAWLAAGAAAGAALFPLAIPFERFIDTPAISDTLALLPIWNAFGHLPFGGSIDWTVAAGGVVAGALFLLVPGRLALLTAAVALGYLTVVSYSVWTGTRGFQQASAGALFQGIPALDRDWIDREVGTDAAVAVLWTGRTDRFTVNQTEFFNRSVGPVYYVGGPTPGGVGERGVRVDGDGAVRFLDGTRVRDELMLLDGTFDPDGDPLAREPLTGMTLWRLDGPLQTANVHITGLYPNDTWSGEVVRYRKEPCRPGTLAVALGSDPSLFDRATTVVARNAGTVLGRIRVAPNAGRVVLRVPLRPRDGICRIEFEISPTAVPHEVDPANPDDRVLGAHFYGFVVER
jgi:4-amino-4-deoxy-L-arabinose transferase-like glycosyltransferase